MSTPPEAEPPSTERREVVETLHGDEIVDPYRWLEGDDPGVEEWVAAQDDHAAAYLGDLPATEDLRPRVETLARTTDYGPVQPEPGGYYQRVRAPEEDHSVLYRRETLDATGPEMDHGDRHALVDPNEMSEDGTTSVDWWSVSGDGALLAYGVAEGGDEQYDVRVADAETGEVIDEVSDVGRTNGGTFAWGDGGFYYVRTGGADGAGGGGQLDKTLLYHDLGDAVGDDTDDGDDASDAAGDDHDDRVVHEDIGPRTWPALVTSRDGRHLVVAMQHGWERSDVYHLGPGDDELQPLMTGTDAIFEPQVAGATAYFRTSLDAPRYRVVACDLEAAPDGSGEVGEPGIEALREVVPEREGMLKGFALFDGGLVTHHQRDAVSKLRVYDRDGDAGDGAGGNHGVAERGAVALPGLGTVDGLAGNRDAPEFCFRYQSFERPPTTARVDVGSDDAGSGGDDSTADTADSDHGADTTDYDPEWLDAPEVAVEADLAVEQVWFESVDGTEVPMFVVARSDVARDGTAPAVLTGYGGFEISRTPAFLSFWAPFVEAGGVFALANLRGGGEYGEAWHEAGKRADKQNTFDDFVAAAEHLVDAGWAHPDRVGIRGGSNGGLTVGAALTQRPDLFAAALCQVPLLDMLRFHQFLLGESWATEYGSPDDPGAYEWLRAYSPYHNVETRDYPPTLFTTAEADTRVHPCHARKMAARLQDRTTADPEEAPVLLRTREQTGHGVGKPVSKVVDEQVEEWGFLFEHLGVSV